MRPNYPFFYFLLVLWLILVFVVVFFLFGQQQKNLRILLSFRLSEVVEAGPRSSDFSFFLFCFELHVYWFVSVCVWSCCFCFFLVLIAFFVAQIYATFVGPTAAASAASFLFKTVYSYDFFLVVLPRPQPPPDHLTFNVKTSSGPNGRAGGCVCGKNNVRAVLAIGRTTMIHKICDCDCDCDCSRTIHRDYNRKIKWNVAVQLQQQLLETRDSSYSPVHRPSIHPSIHPRFYIVSYIVC